MVTPAIGVPPDSSAVAVDVVRCRSLADTNGGLPTTDAPSWFGVNCVRQLVSVVTLAVEERGKFEKVRFVAPGGEGQFWVGSEPVDVWARTGQASTSGFGLTSREIEIISASKEGSSNREIASKLAISEETVKRHLSNIYGKLGVSSRLELAVLASEQHLGID